MMQSQALHDVSVTLRNPTVVEFVRTSIKAGYGEFFGEMNNQVGQMVDSSFEQLASSQTNGVNPEELVKVTRTLLEQTFKKSDPTFWFNRIYHQYKTQAKPE